MKKKRITIALTDKKAEFLAWLAKRDGIKLEKLNSRTRTKVQWLKSQYPIVNEHGDVVKHRQQCRTYLAALEDAGVITESEGRVLFAYITL